MNNGFIQLKRNPVTEELMLNPDAFMLLTLIAYRACRRETLNLAGLTAGQCFVGDLGAVGLTERRYRTAKNRLANVGLASFKGTNKGTIATLLNSDIYDINLETRDEQETNKRRTRDEQETTNKVSTSTNFKGDSEKTNQPLTTNRQIVPPTREEVKEHFIKFTGVNGQTSESFASEFVGQYEEVGWVDKSGKPIANWKSLLERGWLKPGSDWDRIVKEAIARKGGKFVSSF